jgi:hypothetical protein
MTKAIVNTDVFSVFGKEDKHRLPYLKRGEEVTVISESLPALIVETKKGDRVPVNISKVNFKTT